jgi:hypothetical protein
MTARPPIADGILGNDNRSLLTQSAHGDDFFEWLKLTRLLLYRGNVAVWFERGVCLPYQLSLQRRLGGDPRSSGLNARAL